jgi:hypothetical protein
MFLMPPIFEIDVAEHRPLILASQTRCPTFGRAADYGPISVAGSFFNSLLEAASAIPRLTEAPFDMNSAQPSRHRSDFRGSFVGSSARLLRELAGLASSSPRSRSSTTEISPNPPRAGDSEISFDYISDCRYSVVDSRFEKVVHIFHKQWHGIRSSAGVLPGHKIALPSPDDLLPRDIFFLQERLELWGITRAVFHGFSTAADRVLRVITKAGVPSFLVWHGNLSQLVWEPEGQFFALAHTAAEQGLFRRAHMLKLGMEAVFPRSFRPMLVNSPPVTGRQRLVPAFGSGRHLALVPAFPDIRKNLYSSLLGAAMSERINRVLYYADIQKIIPALERCERTLYRNHDTHIDLLHDVDVVVNVTTIDCHPMVDLEAVGAGSMALSGPIYLDTLESHPYTRISVISNPFSISEICERLNYLASMDNSELNEILTDYASAISSVSRSRYEEFLEL